MVTTLKLFYLWKILNMNSFNLYFACFYLSFLIIYQIEPKSNYKTKQKNSFIFLKPNNISNSCFNIIQSCVYFLLYHSMDKKVQVKYIIVPILQWMYYCGLWLHIINLEIFCLQFQITDVEGFAFWRCHMV